MTPLDDQLQAELARIREADLYRVRRVVRGGHGVELNVDGRRCINFCSNDYLGLAADPRPAAAAQRVLARGGSGSGAAALVSGYNAEHAELEAALAAFLGRPRVLLFSSGWAANLGVLRALLGRGDRLIADELNHASLIDGGRLAAAHYVRVAHGDVAGFAAALATPHAGRTLLVSDSVFSMDGDVADLPALCALGRKHGAAVMIDDAHGFGVLGQQGRGAVQHCAAAMPDAAVEPDIYVATLGKSLGAAGAFVAGSEPLIDYLIQRARTWVFSTAPPPAIAAAAREALRIVIDEPQRRQRLLHNIRRFRDGAAARGIALPQPPATGVTAALTPIQPIIVGAPAAAMSLSRALFQRGYWVAAIRPPTVPAGTSRLRVTLSAAHRDAQIDGLLDALAAARQAVTAVA